VLVVSDARSDLVTLDDEATTARADEQQSAVRDRVNARLADVVPSGQYRKYMAALTEQRSRPAKQLLPGLQALGDRGLHKTAAVRPRPDIPAGVDGVAMLSEPHRGTACIQSK
jgi:hypothetical protein